METEKYFDQKNDRLVFKSSRTNAEFWDRHWITDDLKKDILRARHEKFISKNTKRFISPNKSKRVLEGGCGKGQFVYSLSLNGYNAYGVDYAKETVKKINEVMPELNVSFGNVEALNFEDNFFDGYWSLGVIEHFYNGYDKIIKEMERVIKKNGFLFITFPYMSPLRKLKGRFKKYAPFDENSFDKKNFYEFALDHKKVSNDLEKLGFKIVQRKPFDGIKGLKDEISFLNPLLKKIYASNNLSLKCLSGAISLFTKSIVGHSILLIFKKEK